MKFELKDEYLHWGEVKMPTLVCGIMGILGQGDLDEMA